MDNCNFHTKLFSAWFIIWRMIFIAGDIQYIAHVKVYGLVICTNHLSIFPWKRKWNLWNSCRTFVPRIYETKFKSSGIFMTFFKINYASCWNQNGRKLWVIQDCARDRLNLNCASFKFIGNECLWKIICFVILINKYVKFEF